MATKKASNEKSCKSAPDYELRLYVAGQTPRSAQAIHNLRAICEQYLDERYAIEVLDLKLNPALAASHQILAVPTLVRRLPESIPVVIGNLADSERVLVGLDIAVPPKSH